MSPTANPRMLLVTFGLLYPSRAAANTCVVSSKKMSHFFFLLLLLLLLLSTGKIGCVHKHELSADFYAKTCPQVENLVGSVTSQRHKTIPASGPATIRLFFHDAEGFDTINFAKAAVEKMCPGLVSCADILAIAARDFVHLLAASMICVSIVASFP